jgi:uncharacterized integral membrane protein (TIGR00697 family)
MISRQQLICLVIFSMLYIALPICSEILLHKPVLLLSLTIASAGSFVTPLWFGLNDIVAELYGYSTARIMFYTMFIISFIFSLIIFILIKFPSPPSWNGQAGYELVLGHLVRQYASGFIALLIGNFVNLRLITKWRFMLHGRYFWLRSIGASAIGELVFTTVAFVLILFGTSYQNDLVSLILWGVAIKILGNIILSAPATLIVSQLKKTNCTNIFPPVADFNPFAKHSKS